MRKAREAPRLSPSQDIARVWVPLVEFLELFFSFGSAAADA